MLIYIVNFGFFVVVCVAVLFWVGIRLRDWSRCRRLSRAGCLWRVRGTRLRGG